MREQFLPAIEALQKDLIEQERKVAETKSTINRLCELAGQDPIYADIQNGTSSHTLSALQADTFYGKVITTAAREYLEMRKAAGLGPASPREIYEALKQGGFKFDTKIQNNAITGVRNTLRKASAIFHRLPNNEYGLLKWYPRAKDEGTQTTGKKKAKKKRGRPRKVAAPSQSNKVAAPSPANVAVGWASPEPVSKK
jgi:hypothetical protein